MLYEEVIQLLSQKEEWALDNYGYITASPFEILPTTHFMEQELKEQLLALHQYLTQDLLPYDKDKEYEMTGAILSYLLTTGLSRFKQYEGASAKKVSTKMELFRRVNIGLDYIHSHHLQPIDLDSISRSCGLSKFHFIRVFKEVYHQTPADYIAQLRLNRANLLLTTSDKDLNGIATELGFSELSAFTRFFKKQTGRPPSSARFNN